MFDINIDKVCYVIQLGREFDVKVPSVDSDDGSNPTDDLAADVLEDRADDSLQDEFTEFVEGLNDDEKLDLVALMWVGRGTYTPTQWKEARRVAAEEATHSTSEYLLGTSLLADYLEDGLYQLGYTSDDMEKAGL
ncbi:MAG: DUF3775 domain-containing protein [Proteobacteria bacterium]|nr:DUF3775 domain-containing protein [Pseudomonadota bacterium]